MAFNFILLLLLPCLVCNISAEFMGLPDFVSVLEDVRPRNVLAEFQVRNFSLKPDVRVFSVTPHEYLLEAPVVTPALDAGTFDVQIIQNGSMDYERVPMYTVRLQLINETDIIIEEQTLHIRVGDVNEPPQCDPLFQLTGATVHVPEDFPAPVSIYTILAWDPDHNDTTSFSITQVRPGSSSGRFHIDGVGTLTSSEPFDYHNGPQRFEVDVAVRDRQGANCTGTVRIQVLKVYNHPLDFVQRFQSVSIFENQGPESFVAAVKANVSFPDVRYTFVSDYPPFKIRKEDGVIRTAYDLDLEADRALAHSVLLVRAYSLAEKRSGTATVTVTVLDVNEYPPFCFPPEFVLVVPETTEVGSNLGTLTCFDMDASNDSVSVSMIDNGLSFYKFRVKDGQLQVNNTLDYDTEEMASRGFQYEDTILAIDGGTPPRTSQIRVLVTVTPVNEFEPVFASRELWVPEDAQRGRAVGALLAQDRDWPFDNIRYSILTENHMFTVDPDTGQLYLNTELDFELQQDHVVRVQAEDYDQDVDKTKRKTGVADITIHVGNVNDNVPVCDPVSYESTIFSTRSVRLAILQLSCTDADGDVLTATITNGAAVDRFTVDADLELFSRNEFSYVVDGVYDRTMFEVTFSVSDGKHQTTAVAYIYVVPWTTTTPTTTTTTTTKAPQVVTVRSDYWDPDPLFVVMMTVTGGLLLTALGLITWAVLKRKYGWGKETLPSNMDGSNNKKDTLGNKQENDQYSLDGAVSLSKVSLQDDLMRFDGKAQDPISGRSYLFNSTTGERRWL